MFDQFRCILFGSSNGSLLNIFALAVNAQSYNTYILSAFLAVFGLVVELVQGVDKLTVQLGNVLRRARRDRGCHLQYAVNLVNIEKEMVKL